MSDPLSDNLSNLSGFLLQSLKIIYLVFCRPIAKSSQHRHRQASLRTQVAELERASDVAVAEPVHEEKRHIQQLLAR